ncbi:MAG: hypothetical protein HYT87_20210 [Nitrospirae bacterium]|nr:hypothetical protein [Nitrospirota bacterium]
MACLLTATAILVTDKVAGAQEAQESNAAALLSMADKAVEVGNLEVAKDLYERILREHGDTREAAAAVRALSILAAIEAELKAKLEGEEGEGAAIAENDRKKIVIFRREPYSLLTRERVRLSTWEKIDFGVTAFTYGASLGFSYSIAGGSDDSPPMGPVVFGALVYTLGSLLYLHEGNPGRGDLPLVLGITSYVPTTALLASNLGRNGLSAENTSLIVALSGTASVPMALYSAYRFDPDPGDAQLVRDAGFWGMILGMTGMMGFGGETCRDCRYEEYDEPSARAVSAAGLAGLYGGITLGVLAARGTEPSLERIRIATWAGYGGGVLGLLLSTESDEPAAWRGLTIGAAGGLALAYALAAGVDPIPPETPLLGCLSAVQPVVAPVVGKDGNPAWSIGLRWSRR